MRHHNLVAITLIRAECALDVLRVYVLYPIHVDIAYGILLLSNAQPVTLEKCQASHDSTVAACLLMSNMGITATSGLIK